MQIDDEFKNLIPQLTNEEFNQLEENILKEGCREPLIIWNETLVDGHNRYAICNKYNIDFKTITKDFLNREEAKMWIIKNQFGRRNLSDYDKGKLAIKIKEMLKEKAKIKEQKRKQNSNFNYDQLNISKERRNMIEELIKNNKKRVYANANKIYVIQNEDKVKIGSANHLEDRLKDVTTHLPNAKLIGVFEGDVTLEKEIHKVLEDDKAHNEWFYITDTVKYILNAFAQIDFVKIDKVETINARKDAAKMVGISDGQLAKIEKIEEKAPEQVKEKIKNGEMSINQAYGYAKTYEYLENEIKDEIPKNKTKEEHFIEQEFKKIEEETAIQKNIHNAIYKMLCTDISEEYLEVWYEGLDTNNFETLEADMNRAIKRYETIIDFIKEKRKIRRIK